MTYLLDFAFSLLSSSKQSKVIHQIRGKWKVCPNPLKVLSRLLLHCLYHSLTFPQSVIVKLLKYCRFLRLLLNEVQRQTYLISLSTLLNLSRSLALYCPLCSSSAGWSVAAAVWWTVLFLLKMPGTVPNKGTPWKHLQPFVRNSFRSLSYGPIYA